MHFHLKPQLIAALDRLRISALGLPDMDGDPVRRALDDAVVSALGLDGETVAAIRRSLALEPSVTGRRYRGSGRRLLNAIMGQPAEQLKSCICVEFGAYRGHSRR